MFSPKLVSRFPSAQQLFLLLLLLLGSNAHSQIQIWGASGTGGSAGIGSTFSVLDDGSAYTSQGDFLFDADGQTPQSALLLGSDGLYYGTTPEGGQFNNGTIYRFSESTGLEILHHFNGTTDGANARGSLIETAGGDIIGTCSSSGQNGVGVLFRYNDTDGYAVLHAFNAAIDGASPSGNLIYNSIDNTVSGTCINGGTQNLGTIFSYSFSGGITTLHNFSTTASGSNPRGGLTLGSDGQYYGTCQFGGATGQGNIFRFDPATAAYIILHNLSAASADGRFPSGNLVESTPGIFLGACSEGGTTGAGTIFRITSAGVYTRLRSLSSTNDGSGPKGGLCAGGNGEFYGFAENGGSGSGTFFRITEAGAFVKIKNLNATTDGSKPLATPTLIAGNTLVAPISDGGVTNSGTIVKYPLSGTVTKIHDFSLAVNGRRPLSLVPAEGGFMGSTFQGGSFNSGALFFLALNGEITKLHDFNTSTSGQNPNGMLTPMGDGYYIGTAKFGGLFDSGTIFKCNTSGDFEVLHHFDGAEGGQFPHGGVVKHSDGLYYGTTLLGGIFGEGIVYSFSESGEFTSLQSSFGFFDGGNPTSTMTEGADGILYYTNTAGGDFGQGSLVSYNPSDMMITAIHQFSGGADGGAPQGALVSDADGVIYGTARSGGTGGGTLFKFDTTDGFSIVHSFNNVTEGSMPADGVSIAASGKIFGFCQSGGTNGQGSAYSYEADAFQLIYAFSASESPQPQGTPALFNPDCFGDSDCTTTEPCMVARCNFGICEEAPISPVFSTLNQGICQPSVDGFDLTISVTLNASPGGNLIIGGQSFPIEEGLLDYTFVLVALPADGNTIDLEYTFEISGCSGNTGILGTAPSPCPPVFLNLTLHTGDLSISAEGIFVGGSFQGWNPSQYPLTEVSPDLYEATIPLGAGEYEFNFFNGASIFDGEYVIGNCAINGKRQLSIGEEGLSIEACWANCDVNCTVGLFNNALSQNLLLWPNPAPSNGSLNISGLEQLPYTGFQILDSQGKLVQTGARADRQIMLNGLTSGLYVLQIITDQGDVRAGARFAVY